MNKRLKKKIEKKKYGVVIPVGYGVITGNGKYGDGISHGYPIGTTVRVESFGYGVNCLDEKTGLPQVVSPKHISIKE